MSCMVKKQDHLQSDSDCNPATMLHDLNPAQSSSNPREDRSGEGRRRECAYARPPTVSGRPPPMYHSMAWHGMIWGLFSILEPIFDVTIIKDQKDARSCRIYIGGWWEKKSGCLCRIAKTSAKPSVSTGATGY